MVFCRVCQKKVEDCAHCVYPIAAARLPVADPKVTSIAYNANDRILEIAFKSGQVWQLLHVPPGIHQELCDSTISSFLQFIARRYQAVPVKTGVHAIKVPPHEPCTTCSTAMQETHRTGSAFEQWVRIQWSCPTCKTATWKQYGQASGRERKVGRR